MIEVEHVSKTYKIARRDAGFANALRALWHRQVEEIRALDDISFTIYGVDIRKFGSQGQQRTSALALKLSEIEFVKKIIKDTPILLLDDVLSELDSNRQNYLLNNISSTQTIITCTGLDGFIRNRFQINRVFEVIEGRVFRRMGGDYEY